MKASRVTTAIQSRNSLRESVLVSVDVESTGLSPATGNMISIGAATLWKDDPYRTDHFYVNLQDLNPGLEDPDTLEWWENFPERWEETRVDRVKPIEAMIMLTSWLENLDAKPIFVAWPGHFDFGWIDYYYKRLGLFNPFGYLPLDLNSFAAGLLGDPYSGQGSRSKQTCQFPAEWEPEPEYKHNALSDAIAQRSGLIEMLRYVEQTG